MRRPHPAVWLALGALAAGCGGAARVEADPPALQLYARGQAAQVRAVALAANGKALPEKRCAWSSDDVKVARVEPRGNEAAVVAAGPGATRVRCRAGGAEAEIPVSVRILSGVQVSPAAVELQLHDEPEPFALQIRALDEGGRPATPRRIATRCRDEAVCRGDDRGQLWPVGAGATVAEVEADGARAEVAVRVADARTAAGRPRAVKGNPMAEYDKATEALQRQAQRQREQKAAEERR